MTQMKTPLLEIKYEDALKLAEMLIEDEESSINLIEHGDNTIDYIYINNYLGECNSCKEFIIICLNIIDYKLAVTLNHNNSSKLFHVDEITMEDLVNKALIKVRKKAQRTLNHYLSKIKDEES